MSQSLDHIAPFYLLGQTGTGSEVPIPHNLGVVPVVLINLRSNSSKTYVQGTHTSTSILVNVTNGAVYDVFAWPEKW